MTRITLNVLRLLAFLTVPFLFALFQVLLHVEESWATETSGQTYLILKKSNFSSLTSWWSNNSNNVKVSVTEIKGSKK